MGGYRLDGGEDLNLLVAAFGDFEFKTSSAPCRALALARRSKAALPGLHQGEASGAFAFTGHGQLTETSSWLTLSHCGCVDEFEGRARPWGPPRLLSRPRSRARRDDATNDLQGIAPSPPFWDRHGRLILFGAAPRGFAIPELASHRDDLSPALRQRLRHLHLPHRQPARGRGADRRSGVGEGRPVHPTRRRTRPQAGQGGG